MMKEGNSFRIGLILPSDAGFLHILYGKESMNHNLRTLIGILRITINEWKGTVLTRFFLSVSYK